MKNKQLAEAMIIILNVATVSTGTDGNTNKLSIEIYKDALLFLIIIKEN